MARKYTLKLVDDGSDPKAKLEKLKAIAEAMKAAGVSITEFGEALTRAVSKPKTPQA